MSLVALGPDFPAGVVVETPREMIDLPVTIGRILGILLPGSPGQLLEELFPPAAP